MYLDRLEFKNDPLPRCLRIDLRCRVSGAFIFIAAALNVSNYFILAALVVTLVALLFKSIRIVLLRLIPVNIFTLMLWITLPLGAFITAHIEGGPNALSYTNALYDALRYTLRINAASLLYMLFIMPMGISGLCNALSKLAVPKKLVSLLMLTYRFIFVMFERLSVSLLSMRLRKPGDYTMLAQWRSSAALLASSFVSAEFRSQKVWIAMRSRGFDGVFPVTKTFRWNLRDTVMLAASIAFAVFLALLDRKLNEWIF
jgi:cobalt/nickel transport system permease protein